MKKSFNEILTLVLSCVWMVAFFALSIGVSVWAVKWVLTLLGVI